MKTYFAKVLLIGCWLFAWISPGYAQFYTAGSSSTEKSSVPDAWEISAAGVVDFVQLKDASGLKTFSNQKGLSVRALFYSCPYLALGIEGTTFAKENFPGVEKYRVNRLGAVGKLLLSANTLPRSYMLFGIGRTSRELDFSLGWQESADSTYYQLGLGLETDVWEMIFAGAELNFIYNDTTRTGNFYRLSNRWETQLSLRAGIRF